MRVLSLLSTALLITTGPEPRTPDAPVITSPQPGDDVDRTPIITGTGEPGATVEIMLDDEVIGSTTVDENGDWPFTPDQPLPCGEHTLTARQSVNVSDSGTVSPVSTATPVGTTLTSPASDPVPVTVVCATTPPPPPPPDADGEDDGDQKDDDGGVGQSLPDTGLPEQALILTLLGILLIISGGLILRRLPR